MTIDEAEWDGFGDDGEDEVGQTAEQAEPVTPQDTSPRVHGKKRVANTDVEVEAGAKKRLKKGQITELR